MAREATTAPRSCASRIVSDERGAMMVLGIFICSVLVGALWYIAGIGDAIVYRERLQEASDAAALSNALLHARGMNLIVMINLMMACILAIRVALKVVQLALTIAAVIFGALGVIPWLAWMEPIAAECGTAAGQVQNIINSTRKAIDEAIKGLHVAQKGIKQVIPAASSAGGIQVIEKYRPFVNSVPNSASTPDLAKLKDGLPVVDGSLDRLCGEAGEAMVFLLTRLIPIDLGRLTGAFGDLMAGLVGMNTAYFCELSGTNASPPDLGSVADSAADQKCKSEEKGRKEALADADSKWLTACQKAAVTCVPDAPDPNSPGETKSTMTGTEILQKSTKPEDKATLSNLEKLKSDRDKAEEELKAFDGKKCVEKTKADVKKKLDTKQTGQQSNSQGMEPMKVDPKWFNGSKDAQILAYVSAPEDFLRRSPKGVRVGAFKDSVAKNTKIELPVGGQYAYAQAEFFYDCSAAWGEKGCNAGDSPYNDDNEAMWHLRWRARLRRYNAPFSLVDNILKLVILDRGAVLIGDAAKGLGSGDASNLALRGRFLKTDVKEYELH